ncbi:hypothetical protein MK139_13655, partial [bacterium]|nr:hypothetical protein [bacterium]
DQDQDQGQDIRHTNRIGFEESFARTVAVAEETIQLLREGLLDNGHLGLGQTVYIIKRRYNFLPARMRKSVQDTETRLTTET